MCHLRKIRGSATRKILLVDDHPEIRQLVKMTLGKGFEIFEAEDGRSALRLTLEHKPDLLVLDIMMPGEIDGLRVLKAIKVDHALRNTKVILVSARGQEKDKQEGLLQGADAYLVKPFSPLKLNEMIKEMLKV